LRSDLPRNLPRNLNDLPRQLFQMN
jgi:hypothetical protein